MKEKQNNEPHNFASFYTQAIKDKKKKIKKGKYKGQERSISKKDLPRTAGLTYKPKFDQNDAPSVSTFSVKG